MMNFKSSAIGSPSKIHLCLDRVFLCTHGAQKLLMTSSSEAESLWRISMQGWISSRAMSNPLRTSCMVGWTLKRFLLGKGPRKWRRKRYSLVLSLFPFFFLSFLEWWWWFVWLFYTCPLTFILFVPHAFVSGVSVPVVFCFCCYYLCNAIPLFYSFVVWTLVQYGCILAIWSRKVRWRRTRVSVFF